MIIECPYVPMNVDTKNVGNIHEAEKQIFLIY